MHDEYLALEKDKHLWIPLIMDFMDLWYYLEILKMFCLKLYYLGNWYKIFLTRNGFEDFENIVDIWLLKYLMKLLGSKLYILNTFNLWAFDVGLPLCYDIGDYPVFVTCDLTCLCDVWLPRLRDDKPGWRLPLCITWVNPWVCGWGCYPLSQKTTCKKGTV